MKNGIDVSYANRNVDFALAKREGITFAIVRTGYRQKTDDLFESHMKAAQEAGLALGVYCYCMAKTPAEARKEADYVLKLIEPYTLALPVFYDMEDNSIENLSKTKLTNIALAFLDTISNAGIKAGLYANPSWLLNRLDREKILSKYDLWLAHWTNDPNKPTTYDFGQKIWQWGAKPIGSVNVDRDICYFDFDEPITEPPAFAPEIGDMVMFSGGYHYASSTAKTATGGFRGACAAKITNIAKGAPHPLHLIGDTVYGWVDVVFPPNSGRIMKTVAALNLRAEKSLDSAVLAVVPRGITLLVLDDSEKRAKVTFGKTTGFVEREWLIEA